MKKIFPFILCCVTILGCKKNPFDYRTKFIGNYNFQVHEQITDLNDSNRTVLDSIYSYSGNIDYGKDKNDIVISFSNNESLGVILYEDGSLDRLYGNLSINGEFESTQTIKFNYGDYLGLAEAISYNVTGEKK